VSVFDKRTREVRATQVGATDPAAVVGRDGAADNVWTAVVPGGVAVARKEDATTVVLALPDGSPLARVTSGWGYDLRFSPGGRWLTERGNRVFRVFDRTNCYRLFARIPTPRFNLADVADGTTAVVADAERNTVAVWDLPSKSVAATLQVGGTVSVLAISADGQRVLTGTMEGEVTLWNAAGTRLQQYAWGVTVPIAAAFSRDGLCAAAGGTDRQIVVWDLDD
jgi:WD40 repeat protein